MMKSSVRLIFLVVSILFTTKIKAQLTPDQTLGAESSTVKAIDQLNDRIDNGAIRGTNLFHSFDEFNVDQGRGVFFNSSTDIQNILTRVTGGNVSNILGQLGVLGEANLFLINPNGIIFGENASLDLNGSFISTTADALQFGEQGFFSAVDPEMPPLLTVQPSAFIFNQLNANPIENNSMAIAGIDPVGNETFGLRVPDGSSLLMVGGDVVLNGGRLQARGGRVELAGLQGKGTIGLDIQNEEFSLTIPDSTTLSNIVLNQDAEVNVRGADKGSIAISAQNFSLLEGSIFRGGIDAGLGSIDSQAGDIDINVTKATELTDGSISHIVDDDSMGNGGDINITTSSLFLNSGSKVSTSPFGEGNGGSININAINLIEIADGSNLNSSTFGTGNAGDININTEGTLSFDANSDNQNTTGLFNNTELSINGGDGGSINLNAQDIEISNSILSSGSFGSGDADSINLNAQDIEISNSILSSGSFGSGDADSINLNAQDIEISNSSQLFSDTSGSGDGSNINLIANNISINNGARLSSSTMNVGNAGNINLNAENLISVDGEDSSELNSSIFSSVSEDATGNGGVINIKTGSLFLTNGGQLNVSTFGQGNGGEINIDARETVSFSGVGSGSFESGAFSNVDQDAVGDSGNININTDSLSLDNSAVINANTSGNGNAGEINITANSLSAINGGQIFTTSRSNGNAGNINLNIADNLNLSGTSSTYFARLAEFGTDNVDNAGLFSGLFANTSPDSTGNSGSIAINGSDTTHITIQDEAQIAVDSAGTGVGGNIALQGDSLTLNRGVVTAEAVGNQGGNINLALQDLLLLRNGSQINSSAGSGGGVGDGGNVDINTNLLVAFPSENSDITANAFLGNGGRVEINTQAIFGTEFRPEQTPESDITVSSEFGLDGAVEINTLGLEPTQGLTKLPSAFVVSQPLQGCQANRGANNSSFINTGRGGLPPNPYESLDNSKVFDDVQLPNHWAENSVVNAPISPAPTEPVVEATTWVVNNKGKVELVADTSSTIYQCGDQVSSN
ncbi:MAG: filamentous hemagglutinin N-terminal domain-containing protein [Cyanobacteria bacterium P01_A01_bin.40]